MPNKKLLIGSAGAVVVLLAIAVVIEVLLAVFPPVVVQQQPGEEFSQVISEVSKSDSVQSASVSKAPARDYTQEVEHINQYEHLASGCEIVALAVAMQAEGFDVSPMEIADNYLRFGDDVENDYQGSPWDSGGGFARCIVDAANDWLADNGGGGRAVDLTGRSFQDVCALVDSGYPVLAWVTEGLSQPAYDGESWYWPEHCVVLYGYDDDRVYVSDSLEGQVDRDLGRFADIYEACGNRAAYVKVTAQS